MSKNESIMIVNKARDAAACAEANCASSFTNATNAANSAASAAASAASAAESAEIAGIYLGPKSVAPTTDNDGGPLQEGMLYYNTVSNVLFAWNGSAWFSTDFNEFTNFTATGTTTARNLATRMTDVVNVKDFGAIGNGITDDTAAIQSAVSFASTNGCVLEFSSGTFVVNNATFTTSSAIVIRGVPGKTKIIRTSASGSTFVSFNAPIVDLYGITFDFNKANVTANQWGVQFPKLGGTIVVDNCEFKNNSGSLGSGISIFSTSGVDTLSNISITNSKISGCTWNAVYIASKTKIYLANNLIYDNSGVAIYIASYLTKSTTNYSSEIEIVSNKILRNLTGIQFGGFGAPYDFTIPAAKNGIISNNILIDNYVGIALQGHYVSCYGNKIYRENISTSIDAGIFCNTNYAEIYDNYINLNVANWGIDIGGSSECVVKNNTIRMSFGSLLNVGGTDKCTISGNTVFASGSGKSCVVYNVEGDGSGNPFPTVTSALTISNNAIYMDGINTRGVNLVDDAGGASGKIPTIISDNSFYLSNTASSYYAVYCISNSANIYGNTVNGIDFAYINPDVNTNLVLHQVYNSLITYAGSGATFAVASVINQVQNENLAKSSILFVHPTNGGNNYTPATTITASATGGGAGFSATPLIYNGSIIGVRIINKGSGYTGTVTITATDTGGGAGATFSFSQFPTNAQGRSINISSSSDFNVIKRTGGAVPIFGAEAVLIGPSSSHTLISGPNGSNWIVQTNALASVANAAALPAASTDLTYAKAYVRGSATNKFFARCNGTIWTFSDGTTVS